MKPCGQPWRAFGLPIAAFTLLALAAPPAAGGQIDKDFHQSYQVSAGDRLLLEHGDGDVDIQPWDQDVLDIAVRYHVTYKKAGFGSKPDFDVTFKQAGGIIKVSGHETGGAFFGFRAIKRREYTYLIRAPHTLRLQLDGEDGQVTISGWRADIRCRLDDGDLTLDDIRGAKVRVVLEDGDVDGHGLQGELEVSADDGNVTLRDCEFSSCYIEQEDGDLDISAASGDFEIELDDGEVRLTGVQARDCRIRTADGSVRAALLKTNDLDLNIQTDDGAITVELPAGQGADFSVSTDDGSIRVDLPGAKIQTDQPHRVTGKVGKGKGRVRLRTADGAVRLRQGR